MPQFFYHGNFFNNEEEFLKFVRAWPYLEFDEKDFDEMMKALILTAKVNHEMTGKEFTNRHAYLLLRMHTEWVVEEK